MLGRSQEVEDQDQKDRSQNEHCIRRKRISKPPPKAFQAKRPQNWLHLLLAFVVASHLQVVTVNTTHQTMINAKLSQDSLGPAMTSRRFQQYPHPISKRVSSEIPFT